MLFHRRGNAGRGRFRPGGGKPDIYCGHATLRKLAGGADPGQPPAGLWCRGYAGTYLDNLNTSAGDAGLRPVDKQPFNFYHLGLIRFLFPAARFIHTTRDPLDTCLSCYFQNFANGVGFSFDLGHLGEYYRHYRRLMGHWHGVMPGQIHELSYEALVGGPEPVVRKLLEFCELPWDESCLAFATTGRRVTTASSWQVRQPLYQRSVGRHRHYQSHLAPLRKSLGEGI